MATYKVKFDVAHPGLNSEASFEIEVNPEWAPLGAKCVPAKSHYSLSLAKLALTIVHGCCCSSRRFKDLLEAGYFTDCRFHRAVPG